MTESVYSDLLTACTQPGCPICRLEQNAVLSQFKSILYEFENEPGTRQHLRENLGFCHEHAWMILDSEIGETMAFYLLNHNLLLTALLTLQSLEKSHHKTRKLYTILRRWIHKPAKPFETAVRLLEPLNRCPICEQRDKLTLSIFTTFENSPQDATLTNALASSDGLCLPHLRITLMHIKNEQTYKTLISTSFGKLEALRRDVNKLIRRAESSSQGKTPENRENTLEGVTSVMVGERWVNRRGQGVHD